MSQDSKERFEQLETLRKAEWEKFSSRRPIGWKVCIALWTALAVFLAGLIRSDVPELSYQAQFALTIAGVLLTAAHFIWLMGHARASTINQYTEHDIRDLMWAIVKFKRSTKSQVEVSKWEKQSVLTRKWPQLFQGAVTLLLAGGILWFVWFPAVGGGHKSRVQSLAPEQVEDADALKSSEGSTVLKDLLAN